jgi:hypothetical protein
MGQSLSWWSRHIIIRWFLVLLTAVIVWRLAAWLVLYLWFDKPLSSDSKAAIVSLIILVGLTSTVLAILQYITPTLSQDEANILTSTDADARTKAATTMVRLFRHRAKRLRFQALGVLAVMLFVLSFGAYVFLSAGAITRSDIQDRERQPDAAFLIATNINRFGTMFIVLFLTGLLMTLFRYNIRLAGYYDARADALLLLTARLDEGAISKILTLLSPESYDFGKIPKSPAEHAVELAKEVVRVKS